MIVCMCVYLEKNTEAGDDKLPDRCSKLRRTGGVFQPTKNIWVEFSSFKKLFLGYRFVCLTPTVSLKKDLYGKYRSNLRSTGIPGRLIR